MSKEKHTPTEWRVSDHCPIRMWFDISSQKGITARTFYGEVKPIITNIEAEANANFIVKAVNNHDRIVEALDESNKALQKMTRLAWDGDYLQSDLDEAIEKTREANKLLTELK